MSGNDVRPGLRVRVPWGLDHVEGTVREVFGPEGRRFVRVAIELGGPDDLDAVELVSLPVDLLEPATPAG